MLKQIDLFEKEASKFKLDPKSVSDFESWSEFKAAAKTAVRKADSIEEFGLFMKAKKLSTEAQEFISKKIEILRKEGKDADQAAAIAYSMAKQKGFDVPEPPKRGSVEKTADPDSMLDLEHEDDSDDESSKDESHGEGAESHEEGEESPEEEAKELMSRWESGEMSLREIHEHIESEFDDEDEEAVEDLLYDMIDAKFKELQPKEDVPAEEPEVEEGD
jgi:cobalamin biosynthesis protein CobT